MNATRRNPDVPVLTRAGDNILRMDVPVASAPFSAQSLLNSEVDGEMTAMRAWFACGAVSHWHSHPRGQLLTALTGKGRAQSEGGPVIALVPGDSIWFPPGNRHWHGAAPGSDFSYVSVHQVSDGRHVEWMEPVAGNLVEGAGPALGKTR